LLCSATPTTFGSFTSTRSAGAPPTGYASSGCPLGTRCRFVGRSQVAGSGAGNGLFATIRYRLTGQ
jgi:hypothetical protein